MNNMNKPNKMNMEIRISNLKDGNHFYKFENNAEDFEIEEVEFKSGIITNVELIKTGSQFDLKAKLTGTYVMDCERCLEKYELPFDINFELVYKTDYKGEFINDDKDIDSNLVFISPNTHHIDIKNDVRDYLIINIPMRKIPDELNDKCLVCGKEITNEINDVQNNEINPVWEKLLKNKNN